MIWGALMLLLLAVVVCGWSGWESDRIEIRIIDFIFLLGFFFVFAFFLLPSLISLCVLNDDNNNHISRARSQCIVNAGCWCIYIFSLWYFIPTMVGLFLLCNKHIIIFFITSDIVSFRRYCSGFLMALRSSWQLYVCVALSNESEWGAERNGKPHEY